MNRQITTLFPNVKKNISAREISTFGIGGSISYAVEVYDTESLIDAVSKTITNKIPFIVIAGGSNVVFPDGEYKKLVILIKGGFLEFSNNNVEVCAGVTLDVFICEAVRRGFSGLEALSGIPGSVGGAVVGNAGAYGQSISDSLVSVKIFDGHSIQTLLKTQAGFSYRESVFKKENLIILSACFTLKQENSKDLKKIREDIIFTRNKKYKKGILCPGSFFKNILTENLSKEQLKKIPKNKIIKGKVPAGFLLENVGACGMESGDIFVAPFHGNLFINKGHGTYKDLIFLSNILKNRVYEEYGILLEEEVRLLANTV